MADLIDSYSETNKNAQENLIAGNIVGAAQSFNNPTAKILDSCKFYLQKDGSPTNTAVAKLYSITGSRGTTGKPDIVLATSDTVAASSVSAATMELITFTFSGLNRILLNSATDYVIGIEYAGDDGSNTLYVGYDSSAPTHNGNFSYTIDGTSWTANTNDLCFYIYGVASAAASAPAILLNYYH